MEKKHKSNNRINLLAPPTDDERLVCSILVDLDAIIQSRRSKFTWAVKRRRSSLCEQRRIGVQFELKTKANGGAASRSSPNTPLSFLPSQSDESNNENKHFVAQKSSKKRSRGEIVDMVAQLTERRDCLQGEVENVRKYYNQLVSENSKLKAFKQEVLKNYQREQNPVMEINRQFNQATELTQNYGGVVIPYLHQSFPTEQQTFNPLGPITAQYYGGLGMVNNVGPNWIPDLNVSADEAFGLNLTQPLDVSALAEADKRSRFAEARRRRRGLIKIKAMRSAFGITLPRAS